MYTPYSASNASFSGKAHDLAVTKLYPQLLGTANFEFDRDTLLGESQRGQVLDGEMGVDYVARLHVQPLGAPLQLTVQERFRRHSYARYRDITITEWNHNTNLPSELFKITSGIFLYGYVNQTQTDFVEAIAFNVTDLMLSMAWGTLKPTRNHNPRSNQSFVCFTFDQLEDANVVMYHYKEGKRSDYYLPKLPLASTGD